MERRTTGVSRNSGTIILSNCDGISLSFSFLDIFCFIIIIFLYFHKLLGNCDGISIFFPFYIYFFFYFF